MRVQVHGGVGDLARDLAVVPVKAARDCRDVVRQSARLGNLLAQDNAKRTAGAHGKHYPNAFTWEMRPHFAGFGTSIFSAEYGPEIGRPQGGMSFEFGSRNQKPHLDLARSADIIGGTMAQELRGRIDGWFS